LGCGLLRQPPFAVRGAILAASGDNIAAGKFKSGDDLRARMEQGVARSDDYR